MTIRTSRCGEQWLSIVRLCVHQALLMYMHSPPPLFLPESLFWSCRWMAHLASCTAASGIAWWSQVSDIIITQQSRTKLSVAIRSSSSLILCAIDLTLARKRLGSRSLCGCFLSLVSCPARHPRFCFLSWRRLCHLLVPTTIHEVPGGLEMSSGKLYVLWKWLVMGDPHCNPMLIKSCQLYTSLPWHNSPRCCQKHNKIHSKKHRTGELGATAQTRAAILLQRTKRIGVPNGRKAHWDSRSHYKKLHDDILGNILNQV